MKAQTLLTPAARRHISLLSRDLRPLAARLERQYRAVLRSRRYDTLHTRALLAISPVAAATASGIAGFAEDVEYHGGRLARLNMPLTDVADLLVLFGEATGQILNGAHAPAREQLHLITIHTLQQAWYHVRESESQMFYGLSHAEAEAEGVQDLLARTIKILTKAFHARSGRLLLLEHPPAGKLAREFYTEKPLAEGWNQAAFWSFPVRKAALIQLAFDKPYPWLPREQTMLRAAADRCAAAIERARLTSELSRLEAEAHRAEEAERSRIGRELHDDTAQSLLLLRLQLEMMQRDASPELRPRLEQSKIIAERAIQDLRRTIAALSPALLERLGLESALRHLASRFTKRHTAEMQVSISPRWQEIAPAAREVVYRVAQESLQNISKHSRATRVKLCLIAADKKFRLSVHDNGAGFNPALAFGKALSFGLAGMRERAALLGGSLTLRSVPGKGATVLLQLPRDDAQGEK